MGEKVLIGTRYWPTESYLISIGSNVAITTGVKIFTHGGSRVARKQFPYFDVFGKVIIEDNVYIGANSLIMPGVTIEKGSLVAAGSVVTNSIPAGSVVGGNPAKYICSVDDYVKRNIKYNLDSKNLDSSSKRRFLLNMDDSKFMKKKYLKIQNKTNLLEAED